jgi:hypothetical protein
MTRTKRSTLTFSRAFSLKDVDRSFAAGAYELVTDEELIEGLSFAAYRRVGSWLLAPAHNSSNSIEMIPIDPIALAAAHASDVAGEGLSLERPTPTGAITAG